MIAEKMVDFFGLAERLECEYRLTRMSDGARQSVATRLRVEQNIDADVCYRGDKKNDNT